jgi:hypothetical protein
MERPCSPDIARCANARVSSDKRFGGSGLQGFPHADVTDALKGPSAFPFRETKVMAAPLNAAPLETFERNSRRFMIETLFNACFNMKKV